MRMKTYHNLISLYLLLGAGGLLLNERPSPWNLRDVAFTDRIEYAAQD